MTILGRIVSWFKPPTPEPVTTIVVRRHRRPPPRPKRRWTAEGSGTQERIMEHLKNRPMTRKELDRVLPTTTAAQALPRLIERGRVRVVAKTWPYVYEVVPECPKGWIEIGNQQQGKRE